MNIKLREIYSKILIVDIHRLVDKMQLTNIYISLDYLFSLLILNMDRKPKDKIHNRVLVTICMTYDLA